MSRMTKNQLDRLAAKMHRMAYELESDAARVRTSDHPSYADAVRGISSRLGSLARDIEAEIT